MRKLAFLALLGLSLAAAPIAAQVPGPVPGGRGAPGAPGGGPGGAQAASMLLAHTGELELSDAQVVRLAAIARRAHERRQALRASLSQPPAPGAQRQPPSEADAQRMRQRMEQMREQSRTDLRDALAVLTPDQQARAWEMMARRGAPGEVRGARGRGAPGIRRGGRAPGGPGAPGRPGGRGERRPGAPPQAPDAPGRPGQQ
ncbi:MAG TPA: Spy/CpxP family protein refolding chaperone [Longimicrobium sp.]